MLLAPFIFSRASFEGVAPSVLHLIKVSAPRTHPFMHPFSVVAADDVPLASTSEMRSLAMAMEELSRASHELLDAALAALGGSVTELLVDLRLVHSGQTFPYGFGALRGLRSLAIRCALPNCSSLPKRLSLAAFSAHSATLTSLDVSGMCSSSLVLPGFSALRRLVVRGIGGIGPTRSRRPWLTSEWMFRLPPARQIGSIEFLALGFAEACGVGVVDLTQIFFSTNAPSLPRLRLLLLHNCELVMKRARLTSARGKSAAAASEVTATAASAATARAASAAAASPASAAAASAANAAAAAAARVAAAAEQQEILSRLFGSKNLRKIHLHSCFLKCERDGRGGGSGSGREELRTRVPLTAENISAGAIAAATAARASAASAPDDPAAVDAEPRLFDLSLRAAVFLHAIESAAAQGAGGGADGGSGGGGGKKHGKQQKQQEKAPPPPATFKGICFGCHACGKWDDFKEEMTWANASALRPS